MDIGVRALHFRWINGYLIIEGEDQGKSTEIPLSPKSKQITEIKFS